VNYRFNWGGPAVQSLQILMTRLARWPHNAVHGCWGLRARLPKAHFECPRLIGWPGHVKPGSVGNATGLDWFPTLLAAAGSPNITQELLKVTALYAATK
jgi:arylsulfatase A-like enzyme